VKKLFFASRPQKTLLVSGFMLCTVVCLLSIWLWGLGKAPIWIVAMFGFFSVLLVYRFYGLVFNPVVSVDGTTIKILAWSKKHITLDLSKKMDVFLDDTQIIIKQNEVGAGISRYVVGHAAFFELTEIFKKSQQ